MRNVIAIAALALALAGCTAGGGGTTASLDIGPGIEPIPGSITYGGQPRTRLTKSPVGSVVNHQFNNELGQRVEEKYVLQPDRSLKLVSRRIYRGPFSDD